MGIPVDVRKAISADQLTRSDALDSTVRTVVSVGLFVATLVAALQIDTWYAWVAFWVVGSAVLAGAYAAVHEAIHGSLYNSETANHVAGVLWGLPILNPYAAYRSFHFQHHVYTGGADDSEPDLEARNALEYLGFATMAMLGLNALLWRDMALLLVGRPVPYARRTGRRGLALANLVVQLAFIAAVIVATGASLRLIAAVWLVPLAFGSILAGLLSSPEHYGCVKGDGSAFVNTRTIHSNPIVRFLVWNANYHTAHHLAPTVCGRRLPDLQEVIADRCEVTERSYVRYHVGALVQASRRGAPETVVDLRDPQTVERAETQQDYDERAGHRS